MGRHNTECKLNEDTNRGEGEVPQEICIGKVLTKVH